jgi:hypothetical protein
MYLVCPLGFVGQLKLCDQTSRFRPYNLGWRQDVTRSETRLRFLSDK